MVGEKENSVVIEGWVNTNIYTHYNNRLGNFILYWGKKTSGTYKSIKVIIMGELLEFVNQLKKGDYVLVNGYLDISEYEDKREVVIIATKIDLLRTK